MKKITVIEKRNKISEFTVKLSGDIAHSLKIYCETIEIEPEMFIKDAIVKDLIQTYVGLQSEKFIYVGDNLPEVKKPLKHFFDAMKSIC